MKRLPLPPGDWKQPASIQEQAMDEKTYRKALRTSFDETNSVAEKSLSALLKLPKLNSIAEWEVPFVLIEIDDFCYGMFEKHIEHVVIDELEIPYDPAEAAETAGVDNTSVEREEVVNWLADRWSAVGGPAQFPQAYAQFHYGSGVYIFDLKERIWREEFPLSPQT